MKVTPVVKQIEEPKFKPFAIQIEFETEKEYELVNDMLGFNLTIPKVVTPHVEEQGQLMTIMSLIRANIQEQSRSAQQQ